MNEKSGNEIRSILDNQVIPPMACINQLFYDKKIFDIEGEMKNVLSRPEFKAAIKPGMKIAITAGSRGINNIVGITREVAGFVKSMGGIPFLIPAMGSHGGATAEGQKALLESYGITEESIGAPIHATMEVVKICELENGTPVYIDRYANEADGIIVINRIKPHTNFRGNYESGILKMMAVGLGKQYGADILHRGDPRKMGDRVYEFGSAILRNTKTLFAIGIIENAYDQTYQIVGLTPEEIEKEEPILLEKGKSLMPKIPFDHLDVLIIDQIGKNISGTGMDPNITHTFYIETGIDTSRRAQRIIVLDLSKETHGAASGIGLSDATTRRVFNKIDINKTYPNSLTVGITEGPRIPMVFDSDKLAIQAGIKTATGADKENLRMVRIKDTLHLKEIQISEALMKEAMSNPHIEIVEQPKPLEFDEDGNLF
jgi:hypothetical protein